MPKEQCCVYSRLTKKYIVDRCPPRPTLLQVKERSADKNGFRRFFNTNDFFYIGNWKDDSFGGTGQLFDRKKDKYVYRGQFLDGLKHGLGTLYKRNAAGEWTLFYDGEFQHDLPWGKGHLHLEKEGSDYFGDMRNGKRDGFGKAFYKDGSYYFGSWRKNSREGKGYCINENNTCYEGNWFNDMPHGRGMYLFRSGVIQEGVWIEGVCITSTMRIIDYRSSSPEPIVYPIPQVELLNADNVYRVWEMKAEEKANIVKNKIRLEKDILNKVLWQ